MTVLEQALAAVDRGWSVIPCRADKRPALQSWRDAQTVTASRADVEHWDRLYRPAAWAVVTGMLSGLVVLDFDGAPGRAVHERLNLPVNVRTGSGGLHLYVEHPWRGAVANRQGWVPGLDVRGDGGYAIFAGRSTAGSYWMADPDLLPTGRLPDVLRLAILTGAPAPGRAVSTSGPASPRVDARAILDLVAARSPAVASFRDVLDSSVPA